MIVEYLHFKDVDPTVRARVVANRIGFYDACAQGVFCQEVGMKFYGRISLRWRRAMIHTRSHFASDRASGSNRIATWQAADDASRDRATVPDLEYLKSAWTQPVLREFRLRRAV